MNKIDKYFLNIIDSFYDLKMQIIYLSNDSIDYKHFKDIVTKEGPKSASF